jgi:hypothetical protein
MIGVKNMKHLLIALIFTAGFSCCATEDVAVDLATLQKLLTTLDAQIPTPRAAPGAANLLEEIRAGAKLHQAPTKKELSPEQETIVNALAREYGKKATEIVTLIQKLEAALAQRDQRPISEINLKNEDLMKIVRRKLSVAYIDTESAIPESAENVQISLSAQDEATIKKLADDIAKFYKKDFPQLTQALAQKTALHLFTGNFVKNWAIHNITADREAQRFIKQELGMTPAIAQPVATGGILSGLAGKIAGMFGRTAETQKTEDDEWK